MEKPPTRGAYPEMGRGEGGICHGRREGIPMGTGGRSQAAASAGRTASIGTTVPSRFPPAPPRPAGVVFPHASPHYGAGLGPAAALPVAMPPARQSQEGPTNQHHRLTDPPGPQTRLRPSRAMPKAPQRRRSRVTGMGTPYPTNTHPLFQSPRFKNKIKKK